MTNQHDGDLLFTGSIPEIYDSYLVPMIFQPYADDLVSRLVVVGPESVLEVAAGSGAVTRAMAAALPEDVAITATDLNPPMLAHAALRGTARPVNWQPADALQLPFDDGAFDALVCQFGVMFFPDRARALREMRRVVRPGGTVMFNVWDALETSEFAHCVNDCVRTAFPQFPTTFMRRVPHGYFDVDAIRSDLAAAGFPALPAIDTVDARSRAESAKIPAIGFCQGTPLRNEIEALDASLLTDVTAAAAAALADRFGTGRIDGSLRAYVVTVTA